MGEAPVGLPCLWRANWPLFQIISTRHVGLVGGGGGGGGGGGTDRKRLGAGARQAGRQTGRRARQEDGTSTRGFGTGVHAYSRALGGAHAPVLSLFFFSLFFERLGRAGFGCLDLVQR
jgi:hypothetical protein